MQATRTDFDLQSAVHQVTATLCERGAQDRGQQAAWPGAPRDRALGLVLVGTEPFALGTHVNTAACAADLECVLIDRR